jgi:sulfatase maturation enzyme AslB (radical SAM superfamily)
MIDLPVLQRNGGCGTEKCSSGGGGCGSGYSSSRRHLSGQTDVSFSRRSVDLDAIPTTGTRITNIDLDLTVECNLRCVYCFKEKWNEHMEDSVALDAIVWLLHASGQVKKVGVNFMGGEPLLRFQLIKKLVPFAKRRAAQMGKSIHFGMTTNGTLVTPEVVSFWKEWGLGFHTSIDGTREIQDRNRPTVGKKGPRGLSKKLCRKSWRSGLEQWLAVL